MTRSVWKGPFVEESLMKKFKFKYSIIYSHEIVVEGKNEMDARELLNEDYDDPLA